MFGVRVDENEIVSNQASGFSAVTGLTDGEKKSDFSTLSAIRLFLKTTIFSGATRGVITRLRV